MKIIRLVKFYYHQFFRNKIIYIIYLCLFILISANVLKDCIGHLYSKPLIVSPQIIQFYPAIYIQILSRVLIPFVLMVIIGKCFTDELQSSRIILPTLEGYKSKHIWIANWISVNLILFMFLLGFLCLLIIIGLPYSYFYYRYQYAYIIEGALMPPLNIGIIIISGLMLFSQYISYFVLINVMYLLSVIFRNTFKAGIGTGLIYFICTMMEVIQNSWNKILYTTYSSKFISLEISHKGGQILNINHMENHTDYIVGILVCMIPGIIIYYFARKKFINLRNFV